MTKPSEVENRPDLIQGIYVEVAGSKLKAHARKRKAHHDKRAAAYEKRKIAATKRDTRAMSEHERQMDLANAGGYTASNSRPRSEVEELESHRRRHLRLAEFFEVMAEFASALTYRLDPDEMVQLEFVETRP